MIAIIIYPLTYGVKCLNNVTYKKSKISLHPLLNNALIVAFMYNLHMVLIITSKIIMLVTNFFGDGDGES